MPEVLPVLMPNGTIQDQECLTVQDLAALLRTTRDAVYRKTSADQWPYYRVVRRIYFTPEHVRTILSMSDHRPPGAPPRQRAGTVRHLGRGVL